MARLVKTTASSDGTTEQAPLLSSVADETVRLGPGSSQEYQDAFTNAFKYALPLVLAGFLQYFLRLTSLIFVGRMGTLELGATALAQMTTNITGFAALQGFATSLDTICPEVFAAGKPTLIGIYVQRALCMLLGMTGVMAVLWWFSEPLLGLVLPNKQLVGMTAALMRVYIAALPGYAVFEVAKQFVRAQGRTLPILYCLMLGVPLNVLLHWLFIHVGNLGVLSAAAAVSITQTVLPVTLIIYVYFSDTKQCWGGFSSRALENWRPVIVLAIPNLIMVEVDALSWEILALISSYLSDAELAAQTSLGSIMAIAFQIPFTLSIATSFHVASAIGEGNTRKARVASVVGVSLSCIIGLLGFLTLVFFRDHIPRLFTNDRHVLTLATTCMPLLGVVQFFDSTTVVGNGVLRGLGRQKIGSIVMTTMYYGVGLPFAVGATFGLHWRLQGLWAGILLGVCGTSIINSFTIYLVNFNKCVERAAKRTSDG